jgi:phosphonopyruvate decarboxylase
MGALALPPSLGLTNLKYILLNNGAHQSVGSQPTLGFAVDFCTIASGCDFRNPVRVTGKEELAAMAFKLEEVDFLEVRINTRSAENLPRPAETPQQAKELFMNALGRRK